MGVDNGGFGVKTVTTNVMTVLNPLKKQVQNASTVINFYSHFIAPVPAQVQELSRQLSRYNHAFNVVVFVVKLLDLSNVEKNSQLVITNDSENENPINQAVSSTWKENAQKTAEFALMTFGTVSAFAEFDYIKKEVLNKHVIGVYPVFNLAVDLIVLSSTALSLWDMTVCHDAKGTLTENEKNEHWWKVANTLQSLSVVVLAIGLTAAGQSAFPLYIGTKGLKLSFELASMAKQHFNL